MAEYLDKWQTALQFASTEVTKGNTVLRALILQGLKGYIAKWISVKECTSIDTCFKAILGAEHQANLGQRRNPESHSTNNPSNSRNGNHSGQGNGNGNGNGGTNGRNGGQCQRGDKEEQATAPTWSVYTTKFQANKRRTWILPGVSKERPQGSEIPSIIEPK